MPTLFQLTFLLVVLGITARGVRYLLNFPLWGDEAFVAVNFLARDFRGMWEPLLYHQIVPLGFMWADLAMVKLLGISEWTLRLLPFVSGIAGLLLFWRFARQNFGRATALLAVGMLASAYYPIRHAVEVKPYATDLLISLLLSMSAWSVFRRPERAERWFGVTILTGLAVWCSYPAAFVGGGVGLLLAHIAWQQKSRSAFAGCAVFGVVLLASFVAMYLSYARPHAQAVPALMEIDMWQETFPPVSQPWKLPLYLIETHTGNMFAYPMGGKNGGSTATTLLFIAGLVALWRSHKPLLLLLLAPLPLNFIAACFEAYPYGGTARTMLYAAPAVCLIAGVGLAAIFARFVPSPHRLNAVRIACGVFAVIAVGCMIRDIREPYKKPETQENRKAVRWLASQVGPNDQVVLFLSREPSVDHAPYLGHAKGAGAQLVFYLMWLLPRDALLAPAAADIPENPGGETWLVVLNRKKDGNTLTPALLLRDYRQAIEKRLGPPLEMKSFTLVETKKDFQVMEFYRYASSSGAFQSIPPPF